MCIQRPGFIYAIENVHTGDRYIGSTVNPKTRGKQHFSFLLKQKHHSYKLQEAYNQYGVNSFVYKILEEISDGTQMFALEQKYLDFRPAYNVAYVAEKKTRLGLKSSPEHCAKMSKALTGRKSPMEGKRFTEEHKRKIGEANKKAKHYPATEEQKLKLSISLKKYWAANPEKKKEQCKKAWETKKQKKKDELEKGKV